MKAPETLPETLPEQSPQEAVSVSNKINPPSAPRPLVLAEGDIDVVDDAIRETQPGAVDAMPKSGKPSMVAAIDKPKVRIR